MAAASSIAFNPKVCTKRMNVSWKAYKMTSRNGSAKYLQYTTRLDKLIQFLQRDTVFMKLGTSSTNKILLLQKSLLIVLATDVYLVITFYRSSYITYSCYKQTYRWQNNESQKLCENKLGQNAKDFQKTSVLFWSLQTWLQAKMPKSWITTRITTKLFSMRVVLLEKLLKRIQIALWKLGNIVNTTRESITRGSV